MKPSPAPLFRGLARKPIYDAACEEIGGIVLDKVTGLGNGKQGPLVFQPFPCVVQAGQAAEKGLASRESGARVLAP